MTRVVGHPAGISAAGASATGAGVAAGASGAADEAAGASAAGASATGAAPPPFPPAGACPTVPSRALVVKLVKPFAAMISATLKPVLANGVLIDAAELAFSVADPSTAGSTSGTIPRRASVAGRDGSLQMDGIVAAKGLKFCSAATRPLAAARASAPVPSCAMISSAF